MASRHEPGIGQQIVTENEQRRRDKLANDGRRALGLGRRIVQVVEIVRARYLVDYGLPVTTRFCSGIEKMNAVIALGVMRESEP